MSTHADQERGVVFPRADDGRRSTAALGRAVVAEPGRVGAVHLGEARHVGQEDGRLHDVAVAEAEIAEDPPGVPEDGAGRVSGADRGRSARRVDGDLGRRSASVCHAEPPRRPRRSGRNRSHLRCVRQLRPVLRPLRAYRAAARRLVTSNGRGAVARSRLTARRGAVYTTSGVDACGQIWLAAHRRPISGGERGGITISR